MLIDFVDEVVVNWYQVWFWDDTW